MNIGVVLEKRMLYFSWFQQAQKISQEEVPLTNSDYIQLIVFFLQKKFTKNSLKNLSIYITSNKKIFPNWNISQQIKIQKKMAQLGIKECYFPVLILCRKSALSSSKFLQEKSTFLMDLLDFEGLFLLGEKIVTKCSLAKWKFAEKEQGKYHYFPEYFTKKNTPKKPKYYKLITNIVNLYDPHQIIFFTKKNTESYSSFLDTNIPFFQNKLQTKIKILQQDFSELALGAIQQK